MRLEAPVQSDSTPQSISILLLLLQPSITLLSVRGGMCVCVFIISIDPANRLTN